MDGALDTRTFALKNVFRTNMHKEETEREKEMFASSSSYVLCQIENTDSNREWRAVASCQSKTLRTEAIRKETEYIIKSIDYSQLKQTDFNAPK